jgi:alpha-tubulin suppressor-like RCC1 family protein
LGVGDINKRPTPALVSLSNITDFQTGKEHSIVLKDGQIYGFGSNNPGTLGPYFGNPSSPFLINSLLNVKKISSGYRHTLVLNDTGVYGFGSNAYGGLGLGWPSPSNTYTPSLTLNTSKLNIKDISAGNDHSMILDSIGQVYSFGYNGVIH